MIWGLQLKTPQQFRYWSLKIRAFQFLATDGRICCTECGERRWDVLQADHIGNNGVEHRKGLSGSRAGGIHVYRWILRNPDEARKQLQLLCGCCHMLRTAYGFVPKAEDYEDQFDPEAHENVP